jgi:succinoglycan biosynthesis transport protein ExoP
MIPAPVKPIGRERDMLMRSPQSYSTLDDAADEAPAGRDQRNDLRNVGPLLDLRSLWLIFRWRARLIAIVTLGTVLAAVCAIAILPPKYKATTIVLVDPRQPHVTNSEAVLTGIGADTAAVESQVELIESSALAQRVIERLKLASDPEFASSSALERISGGVLELLGRGPNALDRTKANRLIYKFQEGLVVQRRGLTYVIEISYLAADPGKAARISSAVAEAYLDDQRSAKGEITARASGWLADRMTEMRERVRSSEEAVAAYRSANNIVDVTQGNKLINRQVEDLTQQLALTRSRTAEAGARLERMEQNTRRNNDPATLNEALQSPVIANLRSQYAEAARTEADYRAIYGDRHPGLIGVREQLTGLRRQIDNEIARIVEGVRSDYQVAISREAALEAELAKLEGRSATLSEADVKLHELEREAQANRTLFEQFLNRAKETNEQQTLQIADARIVSPALPPLKPNRPGMLLLLIAAACSGLILGVGTVLVLEQTRQGFRSSGEVAQLLSLPSLGSLPWQGEQAPRRLGGGVSASSEAATADSSAAARYALDHPHSPYAKSLRAVRTRLRPLVSRFGSEVLVVISALPGEGKSTFACNFAFAAQRSGLQTLLIDGDVYTASCTRIFGLQTAGLSEVLEGKMSFWGAISEDSASGLHVLGARDLSTASDEIRDVDGSRLASLLQEFAKHFDLVVLDSPAILPVGGTTAAIQCADRAVLLVEWEQTERKAVAEALDMLDTHAAKVSGVVLNKVAVAWSRLFDYGGYRKYSTDA